MSNSEIFDTYAQIAQNNGLISNAEDSSELKKYKNSEYPRLGSDDIATIEALYGVKPEGSYGDYESIIGVAHPKPVVISPAYDRINGLVENEIERQRVDVNIALNPATGKNICNPKYAAKELMMELIRIANDMDSRDQEGLRKLADDCIEKIEKKKFNKIAILPWLIAGGVVLAAIWLWQHADDPDKGVIANFERAIKELDDLKTNSWYESDIDETVKTQVSEIEQHLNTIKPYIVQFNSIMDQIYKPRTLSDQSELQSFEDSVMKHGGNVQSTLEEMKKAIDEVLPMLTTAVANFTSSEYQKQHTHESWLGEMSGWLGEATHGRWGEFANDFISAANALNPLISSLKDIKQRMDKVPQMAEQQQEELSKNSGQSATPEQSEQENVGQLEYDDYQEQDKYKDEEKPILDQNLQYNQIAKSLGVPVTPKLIDFLKDIGISK